MSETLRSRTPVGFVVLPGGRLPERKSKSAAGYDMYARALVSEAEQDEHDARLRKALFNFCDVPSTPSLQEHIVYDPDDETKWAYVLRPGEHVLIGVGVAVKMEEDVFFWLTPRPALY
jgi:dUTPase